jgi:hypothetical protein
MFLIIAVIAVVIFLLLGLIFYQAGAERRSQHGGGSGNEWKFSSTRRDSKINVDDVIDGTVEASDGGMVGGEVSRSQRRPGTDPRELVAAEHLYLNGLQRQTQTDFTFEFSKLYSHQNEYMTSLEVKCIDKVINERKPLHAELGMTTDFPLLPYRPGVYARRTAIHNGQRKLALCEILFLAMYAHEDSIVVYAGAAPCHHLLPMLPMFPTLKFVLYDPRELDKRLLKFDNVEFHREFFTDYTIKQLQQRFDGKKIVFVSDIRTMEEENFEGGVMDDLVCQERWVTALQPAAFSLKFRVPFDKESIEYLDGDIFFQPWGPQATSESRLFGTKYNKKKTYMLSDYERYFSYINSIYREWGTFEVANVDRIENGDHCYDCAFEAAIMRIFVDSAFGKTFGKETHEVTNHITHGIKRPYGWNHGINPTDIRFIQREAQVLTNHFTPCRNTPVDADGNAIDVEVPAVVPKVSFAKTPDPSVDVPPEPLDNAFAPTKRFIPTKSALRSTGERRVGTRDRHVGFSWR